MALRGPLGFGSPHLMRDDALPCSRLASSLAGVGASFGFFAALPFCFLQHGARTTTVRLVRWGTLWAISMGALGATYTVLWEPACEPHNVAAYDIPAR